MKNVFIVLISTLLLFCGVSSGGALAAAIRLSEEVENAHIVTIICDRGDRYLSTDVFPVGK